MLSAYPDNDNWLNNAECGDILSLADKDYIDKCVQNGYFTAGTPQELASFVYYVNTQPVEQGQISLVLTADIDLYDYNGRLWAGAEAAIQTIRFHFVYTAKITR